MKTTFAAIISLFTAVFCFAYNFPDPALDTIVNWAPACFYPDSSAQRLYKLPFDSGRTVTVSNGAFNRPCCNSGHKGYEFDFPVPWGTPVLAARAGFVTYIGDYSGTPCIQISRSARCTTYAYTAVDFYLHIQIDTPLVKKGQKVEQGQLICYTGQVGMADHLHLEVQLQQHVGVGFKNGVNVSIESVPIPFVENTQEKDGILWTGHFYASQNRRFVPNDVETKPERMLGSLIPFEIRPNPIAGEQAVILMSPSVSCLEIFDARGRRMLAQTGINGTGMKRILDARAWPTGVYILKGTVSGQTYSRKFLVSH